MKRAIWSRLARQDLYGIAFDELGMSVDALIVRIETAPLILLDFPELGEKVGPDGRRKWRVKRTPFILLYRKAGDDVEISRVIHSASDWKNPL